MQDNIIHIFISGIIQGLTEFLPISSSGHLVVLNEFSNIKSSNLNNEIILHLGTVFSILIYYKNDILSLIKNFFKGDRQLLYYIIIGCLPISIIGYTGQEFIYTYFTDILFLPYTFMVSGIFLFLTRYSRDSKDLTFKIVLITGLLQILALLPGISRSGITISSLLILGVNQKDSIRFSFLMAIPLILGSFFLKVKVSAISNIDIIGIIISFLFGWLAIYLTNHLLQNKKYWLFSIYCFIISLSLLIWNLSL